MGLFAELKDMSPYRLELSTIIYKVSAFVTIGFDQNLQYMGLTNTETGGEPSSGILKVYTL